MRCLHCVTYLSFSNSSWNEELCSACVDLYCVDCSRHVGNDPKYYQEYVLKSGKRVFEPYCLECYMELLREGGVL